MNNKSARMVNPNGRGGPKTASTIWNLCASCTVTDIKILCRNMKYFCVMKQYVFWQLPCLDDIVFSNQLCGHLMQVALALIGNLLMLPGKADMGLFPVLAALWFSGQLSLQFGQFFFWCLKPLGVEVITKSLIPTSRPTTFPVLGSWGLSTSKQQMLTKNLPLWAMLTVAERMWP